MIVLHTEEMIRGIKCLAQGHETGKGRLGLEDIFVCKACALSPSSALQWGRKKNGMKRSSVHKDSDAFDPTS